MPAQRKGKPVARRARKTRGLIEAAQLPKGAYMSQSRRYVAAMAMFAALLALPATASAKSSHSMTAKASVQVSVDKADKAVKRLKRYARLGNSAGVARQLKIARSQSAAASKKARRMANKASTGTQTVAAASALTLAGTQYDQLVEVDHGDRRRDHR